MKVFYSMTMAAVMDDGSLQLAANVAEILEA